MSEKNKPRVKIYETTVTRSFVGFDMTQKATHEFDVVVSDFAKNEMPKAATSLKVVLLSAYESKDLAIRKLEKENEILRSQRIYSFLKGCKNADANRRLETFTQIERQLDTEIKNEVEKIV